MPEPIRMGGARVLPRLRAFLADLGVMSVPGFASLPGAMTGFDEDGRLTDERADSSLAWMTGNFDGVIGWLAAACLLFAWLRARNTRFKPG